MGDLPLEWRAFLAGALLIAAAFLFVRSARIGGGLLPRKRLVPWLRSFRLAALGLGCMAVAAGLATETAWLIGLGLAFGLEETMETSACLSALKQGRNAQPS
jgi:hypothetical protein